MKRFIPLYILLLSSFALKAQTYQPLNLDTSCYWIQYYNYYSGASPNGPIKLNGEVIQYVKGDTIINGQTYLVIKGYSTTTLPYPPMSHDNYNRYIYNCYNPLILIREDSVAKKIYRVDSYNPLTESVFLDFDLSVGDSMSHLNTSYTNTVIDSAKNVNYYGVPRRTLFGAGFQPSHQGYNRIEGIGATLNFPDMKSGEWGMPVFRLSAFIKNATLLYKDDNFPVDSCYRKPVANLPCWPLSVNKMNDLESLVVFRNNTIIVDELEARYSIRIMSLQGQLLLMEKANGHFEKNVSYLPHGIYILSIHSKNRLLNKKILIQ